MKKTKSSAAWNGLSGEQREALERWLFEENMSFVKALAHARQEFGFAGSMSSLQRFYHRTAEMRMLREGPRGEGGAEEAESRRMGMREVGKLFVKQVKENPDGVKEWWMLAKLLLQSEENGLRRELLGEDNNLRRAGLDLAREKFEFNAAEAALHQLANSAEMDAEELAREKARVMAVRKRLFGRLLTEDEAAGKKEVENQDDAE